MSEIRSNVATFQTARDACKMVEDWDSLIKAEFERAGVLSESNVYIEFTVYETAHYIDVTGEFSSIKSVTEALSNVFDVSVVEEGQKLKFVGGQDGTYCRTIYDEWTMSPTVRKEGKPAVALSWKHFSAGEPSLYVSVGSFPVPGYLVGAFEPQHVVEERIKKHEESVRSRRIKSNRRVILIGPEELSLCKKEEEESEQSSEEGN